MHDTGSKWLDRLRRSKGFPAGEDTGLDQFLSHGNANFPDSPISNPSHTQFSKQSNPNGVSEQLSSVLCELFNFGKLNNNPREGGKKGTRKQGKPRICVISNPGVVGGDEVMRMMGEENGDVDETVCDFVGFSRTQVTVIDTSYPWWKCEKVVFRKKNVWRVRDRKCKSTNVGVKKRKAKKLEHENDGTRKKLKQNGLNEVTILGNNQNEKTKLDPEENPDTTRQVQKKRFRGESQKGSDSALKKRTLAPNKRKAVEHQ